MAAKAAGHKKKRDERIADLSINLIPKERRREVRAANQALLASELQEAVRICLENDLLMPTPTLLRSLIDTCVLGVWILKYAKDGEVTDSVAHLNTPALVKEQFKDRDQQMFDFMFEKVKGTENELYRDVLHPSVHGDALHVAMRMRDKESEKAWIHRCIVHTNVVFSYFLLQFKGKLPPELNEALTGSGLESVKKMNALLRLDCPTFCTSEELV
ncbi:hypothetical protein [Terracidiphilus gabretensis]|uniref:hypothetical protein n=1 Tax=Terracidiphilus gabretensis TaxID=1577687 RepID=UPI00071C0054|nr:hypothetical protein [Terracidiphilus gabretensis]